MKKSFVILILVLMLMGTIMGCQDGEEKDPTPTLDPGYSVKLGEKYPPERDYASNGDRSSTSGEVPSPEWSATYIDKNGDGFDWDDDFDFGPWPDKDGGLLPDGDDADGTKIPSCEPSVVIMAFNWTPITSCDPYPEKTARACSDAMYRLAAMACKKVCNQVPNCPKAEIWVPALYESWYCADTEFGGRIECVGYVECKCEPES